LNVLIDYLEEEYGMDMDYFINMMMID